MEIRAKKGSLILKQFRENSDRKKIFLIPKRNKHPNISYHNKTNSTSKFLEYPKFSNISQQIKNQRENLPIYQVKRKLI